MVGSSCYTYTWDIKMDWGLMDGNEDNRFLREEVVYSSKAYYYFAILEDLVLRLGWAVKLALIEFLVNSKGSPVVEPTIVTSVLAFLEIFRRFVWNFFRLENEHLNNCGEIKSTFNLCKNECLPPARKSVIFVGAPESRKPLFIQFIGPYTIHAESVIAINIINMTKRKGGRVVTQSRQSRQKFSCCLDHNMAKECEESVISNKKCHFQMCFFFYR